MVKLVNRAKMTTATTGTGTITLGSVVAKFQSFADAGVSDGDEIRYVIEDGNDWEIGTGTYTASGTTLSRTVSESSNSDAALNLSGSAEIFCTAVAEDFDSKAPLSSPAFTGNPTAPTQTAGNNSTRIATTAFVQNAVSGGPGGGVSTGTVTALNWFLS